MRINSGKANVQKGGFIDQESLNRTRMDEWEFDGKYQQLFRIPLTTKHSLAVGRWKDNDEWGVDLRRWSYNEGRLLGQGIGLQTATWTDLVVFIQKLYEQRLFAADGGIREKEYIRVIKIDECYDLRTSLFTNDMGKCYLSATIYKNGNPQVRKYGKSLSILIRFDTIPDFLAKCQEKAIIPQGSIPSRKREIDKETGKEIL